MLPSRLGGPCNLVLLLEPVHAGPLSGSVDGIGEFRGLSLLDSLETREVLSSPLPCSLFICSAFFGVFFYTSHRIIILSLQASLLSSHPIEVRISVGEGVAGLLVRARSYGVMAMYNI